MEIYTDASDTGWGATFDKRETHGHWSLAEMAYHIIVKEIMGVYFGLKSLMSSVHDMNIKLNIDNTTAVGVIRHMGTSHSPLLNTYVKKIWL